MATGKWNRRAFLINSGGLAGALVLPLQQKELRGQREQSDKREEEEVTPSEDLMREHGVLRRVILVYDEFSHRLDAKQEIDPKLLASASDLIKRFVEEYHEKQEEDYVFPRLQKAGKQVDLVTILLQQHQAGRIVTMRIHSLATAAALKSSDDRDKLKALLHSFARMYRPHAAREDTVLFPAFRGVLSKNEYDSLGEQFEKNETKMFGEGGFEKFLKQVSTIERALGIYDLSQFTPTV